MANLTFPSNPTNGQKYVFNGKVFEYNSATQRWSATRAQLLGSLPDDVTIDAPTLGVSLSTVALDTVGANVYITYTVDQDVDASLSVTGIEDTTATLHKSNNTIVVTAGATDFSGGQINLVVTNGRTSDTETIDVSLAVPQGLADPTSWTLVGSVADATFMNELRDVVVDGDYAYNISHTYFSVIDISTPSSPTRVASVDLTGIAVNSSYRNSLIKIGNYVYALSSSSKIFSINVSAPSSPSLQWSYDLGVIPGGTENHINYDGANHIYVGGQTKVLSFNISNPTSPTLADEITNTDVGSNYLYSVVSTELYGNYLICVVAGVYRFTIIDVSNPASMSFHGTYAGEVYWGLFDGGAGNVAGTVEKDGIVYMFFNGGGNEGNANLIQAWDFTSNITNPTRVSWFKDDINLDRPFGAGPFDNDYLYVCKENGKITVVDISQVSSNNITFVGESPANNKGGCDISGGYVITTDRSNDITKIYS